MFPERVYGHHVARLHPALDVWKPVLARWAEIIEHHVEYYIRDGRPTDAPYWYNERASVSTLAGAAWLTPGSLVLEEYRVERISASQKSRWGRADLWFMTAKKEFVVEAKPVFPATPQDVQRPVTQLLDEACAQAECGNHEECATRVGLVFVAPSIPPQDTVDDFLLKMASALDKCGPDLLAWTFPAKARRLTSTYPGHEGRIFPGVFMVGRLAGAAATT